jgi:hypothetical protein
VASVETFLIFIEPNRRSERRLVDHRADPPASVGRSPFDAIGVISNDDKTTVVGHPLISYC